MNEKRLEEIISKRENERENYMTSEAMETMVREFLEDLSTLKEEKEMLLGEDKPHGGDLGCRIYGYLKGDVKVTRVEYYKEEKDNVGEIKKVKLERSEEGNKKYGDRQLGDRLNNVIDYINKRISE